MADYRYFPIVISVPVDLQQGFLTFSRSRTTWVPRIVNAYHFFQNNQFDRILVYSEEYILKQVLVKGVSGTRFGSIELKIGSLESAKIIIGSIESDKSGPCRSIPGT